jgi:hypothetical protein
MKKLTTVVFLLALAIGAGAETRPNANGHGVPPNAHPGPTATNSTVNVPPVAKVPPSANRGGRK